MMKSAVQCCSVETHESACRLAIAAQHRRALQTARMAALVDDDVAAPLERKVTRYEIDRPGLRTTLSVDGFAYTHDARGGNLSKYGKATGEAFWPAGALLMDYLVHDCVCLRGGGSPRNVVELGCGLGLCGLVAAALLGDGSKVALTDGDEGVVDRARASAAAAATTAALADVKATKHWWGEDASELTSWAGGPFDLVIAAEVLYDPKVADAASAALAASADALLRTGPTEDGREPSIIVAFERRGVSLDVLTEAFAKRGFLWAAAEGGEGYYEDIYGGRHDGPNVFWHRVVLRFTRAEAPPPFTDLTEAVSGSDLDALDASLARAGVLGADWAGDREVSVFAAESRKYGDALELRDRDTSTWCADAFQPRTAADDFKACRAHRGDPRTWRPNANAGLLPGVVDFASRLPFFEATGKIAVILNGAGEAGVEHADHALPDLVSEFVWIRPPSSTKRFYVRDDAGEKREVPSGGAVVWFDDARKHCLEPSDEGGQVSIRVDGRFNAAFRAKLVADGSFASEGRPAVLAAQTRGPPFLYRKPAETAQVFAAGDAVEAAFGSGSVWYDAVVTAATERERDDPLYAVRYDEDGEEEDLEPWFLRPRPPA